MLYGVYASAIAFLVAFKIAKGSWFSCCRTRDRKAKKKCPELFTGGPLPGESCFWRRQWSFQAFLVDQDSLWRDLQGVDEAGDPVLRAALLMAATLCCRGQCHCHDRGRGCSDFGVTWVWRGSRALASPLEFDQCFGSAAFGRVCGSLPANVWRRQWRGGIGEAREGAWISVQLGSVGCRDYGLAVEHCGKPVSTRDYEPGHSGGGNWFPQLQPLVQPRLGAGNHRCPPCTGKGCLALWEAPRWLRVCEQPGPGWLLLRSLEAGGEETRPLDQQEQLGHTQFFPRIERERVVGK